MRPLPESRSCRIPRYRTLRRLLLELNLGRGDDHLVAVLLHGARDGPFFGGRADFLVVLLGRSFVEPVHLLANLDDRGALLSNAEVALGAGDLAFELLFLGLFF